MDVDDDSLKTRINDILQHLNFDEHNKASTETEQFICEWPDRVQQVLIDLKYTIERFENVDRTLADFPDLCQFLGRLNNVSILALHPNLSNLVTDCILQLYTEQPSTALEKKTQKWVLFQIRNSISLPQEQEVLFELVGKTSNLTYQKAICLLNQHVADLKKKTTTFCGYLIPSESKSPQNLDELCRMLTILLYNQDQHFSSLVDAFMDLLSVHSNSETVRGLFKKITYLQGDIYTENGAAFNNTTLAINKAWLSPKSLVKLWTSYLPSLEHEVLSLVTQTVKIQNSCSLFTIKSLLECRCLPQSCAFNYQLFYTTTDIFHSLIQPDFNPETGGRQSVLIVISLFYDSIHENLVKNSQTEESFLLSSLYPPHLSNFIKHIQTIPLSQGVSSPLCIKNISFCVKAFYEEIRNDRHSLAKTWLYCQHFTLKLIPYFYQQLFILPDKDVSDCLFLLLWFCQPLSSNNQQILSILAEFLSKLKILFKTSNGNVEELLPNVASRENDNGFLKPLFHCLLLACFISADEELELTDRLLELVSGCKELQFQVRFFISSQFFLPLYQPKTKRNYLRVISLCRSKLLLHGNAFVDCQQACTDIINAYS